MHAQIIDANLNRVSEGLRVIEDYVRLVCHNSALTERIKTIRHRVNLTEVDFPAHLASRDVALDVRAGEIPAKRDHLPGLLKANFKRVTEGLRVLEEYTGNPTYTQLRYEVYTLEKEVLLPLIRPVLTPGIYYISDSVERLVEAMDLGVTVIQLRDKHATKGDIFSKAKEVVLEARKRRIPFIVNDYLDIALRVGADGVHTGQDDVPIQEQRALLGEHRLIGRTTHTFKQGLQAKLEGADYVSVGPIWETPSKPGREGIGFSYLKQAHELAIPYVAIGGVNADTLQDVLPFSPPFIGLIRDFSRLDELVARFNHHKEQGHAK